MEGGMFKEGFKCGFVGNFIGYWVYVAAMYTCIDNQISIWIPGILMSLIFVVVMFRNWPLKSRETLFLLSAFGACITATLSFLVVNYVFIPAIASLFKTSTLIVSKSMYLVPFLVSATLAGLTTGILSKNLRIIR